MSRGLGALQRRVLLAFDYDVSRDITLGTVKMCVFGSCKAKLQEVLGCRQLGERRILDCTPSQAASLNRAIAGLASRGLVRDHVDPIWRRMIAITDEGVEEARSSFITGRT
jgi:hypothetical protein